jgi:CubicO group peptidase (beta-lactamase class C family)
MRRMDDDSGTVLAVIDGALAKARALGERGVQVAAFLDGELIVNQWAGEKDADGAPVDQATLFPIFSTAKAVVATALHIQAERGLVDVDAPIVEYWPEYGAAGKDLIRIKDVLSHRAGVPQMPEGTTADDLGDWDGMVRKLEQIVPIAPPDTINSYHSMSFGWLIGEVVRRTDPQGRSFGQFVEDEICGPLAIPHLYFGLPGELEERVAELSFPDQPPAPDPGKLIAKAMPAHLRLAPPLYNSPAVHAAVIPSVGAIADAFSIARFFAMIARGGELDGVRLLSEDRVRSLLTPRADFLEHDVTYGRQMPVGTGGFWLRAPDVTPTDPEDRPILAHPGAGGTISWAELDTRLSVSILHNRQFPGSAEPPFRALGAAIREVAGLETGRS